MKGCRDKVRPLLDAETVVRLQAEYLDNMRKNYSGWMRNTINAEMEDWKKSDDPEQDTERWQVVQSSSFLPLRSDSTSYLKSMAQC